MYFSYAGMASNINKKPGRSEASVARAVADGAMLALDPRGARAAAELVSLFDFDGDGARFSRPENRAVYVIECSSKGGSATLASADDEATAPHEGGGPLARTVGEYARARGLDPRLEGTLRRCASIAAQRSVPTASGRRAVAGLAMDEKAPLAAVKCLARCLRVGLSPACWAPRVPRALAELCDGQQTADDLLPFVQRHEPCVLRGWDGGGAYGGDLGDDEYLRAKSGARKVPTRDSWLDLLSGDRVFASCTNGEAALAEILDLRVEEAGRLPTRYAAKVDVAAALPEVAADLAAKEDASPRAVFGRCFGAPQPVHCYVAPGGAATATHVDPAEQLLLVVSGTKSLRLFAPNAAAALRPANAPLFTVGRLAAVGQHAPFSENPPAPHVDVALCAGDLLYLPALWWHAVSSAGPSTILNFWMAPHPAKAGGP